MNVNWTFPSGYDTRHQTEQTITRSCWESRCYLLRTIKIAAKTTFLNPVSISLSIPLAMKKTFQLWWILLQMADSVNCNYISCIYSKGISGNQISLVQAVKRYRTGKNNFQENYFKDLDKKTIFPLETSVPAALGSTWNNQFNQNMHMIRLRPVQTWGKKRRLLTGTSKNTTEWLYFIGTVRTTVLHL